MIKIEILKAIDEYLQHNIELDKFIDMIIQFSANDQRSELLNIIELRIAEYTSGHWTEDELYMLISNIMHNTIGKVI